MFGLFAHRLIYPSRNAPFAERGWTQETDEPWRKGSSVVLRAPFSRHAVALGVWHSKGSEDDFHAAVGIRHVDTIETAEIREW